MANKGKKSSAAASIESQPKAQIVSDDQHPDYINGTISETANEAELDERAFTPIPGGPIPGIPRPILPDPTFPRPIPIPPIPSFCVAVSGKYRYSTPFRIQGPPIAMPGPISIRPTVPRPTRTPIIPINFQTINVRVDVDRFYPQKRISIEVTRTFPRSSSHAVAEVTSDVCSAFNRRTITANITYRDGNAGLIPGTTVTFRARRTTGFGYGAYELELSGGGISSRKYALTFVSEKFDAVEFEVDRVANAGTIVTSIATHDHPNRPASIPSETLTLATIYERAGFSVSMSPNTTVIPNSGAGTNGTWSDAEMHNAMVTYWSRFGNNPNWAMWVLYAARHDRGRTLGGVMFDDIGPNHRQGTAIFTDSFIQDVTPGDPNPAAWRRRMEFWTAIHEMGHAFNLAHAWQKALGTPEGLPGDPWIPIANDFESRSFMNYPFNVAGGESAFFSDFQFRFSDEELIFMRHAPRRFVQMGNSDWFVNHGFEAPDALMQTGAWALEIRPNREENVYRFLEPVTMELKLINKSSAPKMVDEDMLSDGGHITVFVQREGGQTRKWSPMITKCHEEEEAALEPGKAVYGTHIVSASSEGWLVDEPGFYKLQAAVDMGDEIIVSNVLRLYVVPPESMVEAKIAPDYFTEDVGRAIVFEGAPVLDKAMKTLERVTKEVPANPAANHAKVAVSAPGLRDFKMLKGDGGRESLEIKATTAKVEKAASRQKEALLDEPEKAADTMGHIPYFERLRKAADALKDCGDTKGAADMMKQTIDIMKKRGILASVIDNAQARLKRMS